jgi:hypothetical protein|tara:strand:+ start:1398 stop:2210 length:813 start_codon:yes stop_codon:yes gene_type:complete
MGFKLPGKSIQSGTSGHSSALKMVTEQRAASALKMQASPAKSPEYDKAAKKDSELGNYVAERKKIKAKYGGDRKKYRASEEYKANQNKINKAYGIDDGYVAPAAAAADTETVEDKEEKTPRVVKTKSVEKSSTKTVNRKDGTIKKQVDKYEDEDESGKDKVKVKETYRKDGTRKKNVVKGESILRGEFKNQGKTRTRTVKKYDKEDKLKKSKEVDVRSGRRTVTKTNDKGETTVKRRRTIKGFLTGKGKMNAPYYKNLKEKEREAKNKEK